MEPITEFVVPEKTLLGHTTHLEKFRYTVAYKLITHLLSSVNAAVKSKNLSDYTPPSPGTTNSNEKILLGIKNMIDKAHEVLSATPPVAREARFGNPNFRLYVSRITEHVDEWHKEILPVEIHPAIVEFRIYFIEMMGCAPRLDYGTGHELAFLAWITCFFRMGLLGSHNDLTAIGLYIEPAYLHLAQRIQEVYTLEPAGSHGAWSVDDYQLLPFVWGSSQRALNKCGIAVVSALTKRFNSESESSSGNLGFDSDIVTNDNSTKVINTDNNDNGSDSALSIQEKAQRSFCRKDRLDISNLDINNLTSLKDDSLYFEKYQEIPVQSIFSKTAMVYLKQFDVYSDALVNIYESKTGPLYQTSPFLSELHTIKGMNWSKLNQGMLNHYHREILNKWPVMQHFYFGNILPFKKWNAVKEETEEFDQAQPTISPGNRMNVGEQTGIGVGNSDIPQERNGEPNLLINGGDYFSSNNNNNNNNNNGEDMNGNCNDCVISEPIIEESSDVKSVIHNEGSSPNESDLAKEAGPLLGLRTVKNKSKL